MNTTKRAKAKRPAKSPRKTAATKTPAKKAPSKLTVRQERFCEFIAAGRSGTDAWIEAGHECTRATARAQAALAITKHNVAARIAQLRAPQTAATVLTRDRKRELLREIAETKTASLDARIRAMAEDSRMAGHYEPDRVEVETGPNALEAARERARAIASPLAATLLKNRN